MGFLTNFMDFFWMFLTVLVFLVYLFAVFAIVSDLFRDSNLAGWVKAFWLVFLIGLPFVGALVYLIARGRGMAERQQAANESNSGRSVFVSPADEIAKAKSLLDAGIITPAEYDSIKARVTR